MQWALPAQHGATVPPAADYHCNHCLHMRKAPDCLWAAVSVASKPRSESVADVWCRCWCLFCAQTSYWPRRRSTRVSAKSWTKPSPNLPNTRHRAPSSSFSLSCQAFTDGGPCLDYCNSVSLSVSSGLQLFILVGCAGLGLFCDLSVVGQIAHAVRWIREFIAQSSGV